MNERCRKKKTISNKIIRPAKISSPRKISSYLFDIFSPNIFFYKQVKIRNQTGKLQQGLGYVLLCLLKKNEIR